MRGKKGFLRILEAFIAVLLIAGVLIFLYTNQIQKPNKEAYIRQIQRIILDEIANNDVLRGYVLNNEIGEIKSYISNNNLVPSEFESEIFICEMNSACINAPEGVSENEEIYVDEVSISSTLENFSPKIIRLFIWEK